MIKELNALLDTFDDQTKLSVEKNRFAYVFSKAYLNLKMGPTLYRQKDAFEMPDINWPEEYYPEIEKACKQILEGKGFTSENPIVEIDTTCFYYLFHLFHYEPESRISTSMEIEGKSFFLDGITFHHYIEDSSITYYNLVPSLF